MNKQASRIRVSQFLSAIAIAVVGVITFSQDADARWKWGPEGCQWVDEAGGDQCDPNEQPVQQGRYKSDGTRCWFDPNDYGVNQCDPNIPASDAPPVTEESVPQFEVDLTPPDAGGGQTGAVTPAPSCRDYMRRGSAGYISVQVSPFDGSLQWGAYMSSWQLNFGIWNSTVYVNGIKEDQKFGKLYPPHASLPAAKVPPGSYVSINVSNTFVQWVLIPIYIPEFGWTYVGDWVYGRAIGSLQCIMPVPGL